MKNIKEMFEDIKEIEIIENEKEIPISNYLPYFCKKIDDELNYAEKCHSLENGLGCPLEVLQKIKKDKQIYISTYVVQNSIGANTTISKGMYTVRGIDILNNQIQCLAQFSDCYMEFYVSINEYKVGWFLKNEMEINQE